MLPFINLSSGGILVVLRLLRLLRVVRLLNSFPALQSVTSSLILAFSNVIYVMLMILIINFVFAVIAMLLFAENDPQHFGRMSSALISIWMVETFDAWENLLKINMYGCMEYGYYDNNPSPERDGMGYPTTKWACDSSRGLGWIAALYFVFVAVLGGLILPTVLIGVISIAFNDATAAIKDEARERRLLAKVIRTARNWDANGGSGSGGGGASFVSDEQIGHAHAVFELILGGGESEHGGGGGDGGGNDDEDEGGFSGSLDGEELLPFLEFVCSKSVLWRGRQAARPAARARTSPSRVFWRASRARLLVVSRRSRGAVAYRTRERYDTRAHTHTHTHTHTHIHTHTRVHARRHTCARITPPRRRRPRLLLLLLRLRLRL